MGGRRLGPFVLGFFVAATLLLALNAKFAQQKADARKPAPPAPIAKVPSTSQPAPVARSAAPLEDSAALSPIQKFVRMESLKVGRPDPDPKLTFRRLKTVASRLKRLDIEDLKANAVSSQRENDERFLSVYLLSLSANKEAMPALMAVALSRLSIQDVSSRLYADELMIRTQALEGIARHDARHLKVFLTRQDNAFLADQARRLLREKSNR